MQQEREHTRSPLHSRRSFLRLGAALAAAGAAGYVESQTRPLSALAEEELNGGTNVLGVPATSRAWYFAEGYTGPGFVEENIVILNPGDTSSNVLVTYQRSAGLEPVQKSLSVAPRSRFTVPVHDTYYGVGRDAEVSAKVESTNGIPIAAERTMYFVYKGIKGAHTSIGARAPHTDWYFAEGYTGPGFDEYLTIQNPDFKEADLRVTYFLQGGKPVIKDIRVAGNTRRTISVHDEKEGVGRDKEVSALVQSANGVNVVVERPMYFKYMGDVADGHIVMGTNSPSPVWYFAEGYTGPGFDEYLTIMNPQSEDTQLRVTYLLSGGQSPVVKLIMVPANSRYTIAVHDPKEGVGRNQEVSAKVESINGAGIVVERPMYFKYGDKIKGGHNAMGATQRADKWYFPDGGTTQGTDTYLTIMNPNGQNANVSIKYFSQNGQIAEKNVFALANARTTVRQFDPQQGGVARGQKVGSELGVDSNVPIIVEREMYFERSGGLVASGNMLSFPSKWKWGQKGTYTVDPPGDWGLWQLEFTDDDNCGLVVPARTSFWGDKVSLRNYTVGKAVPGQTCDVTVITKRMDHPDQPIFFETDRTTITP